MSRYSIQFSGKDGIVMHGDITTESWDNIHRATEFLFRIGMERVLIIKEKEAKDERSSNEESNNHS